MPVHQDKHKVLKDSNGHSEISNNVNAAKKDFVRIELAISPQWISSAPIKKEILESRTTPALNRDQN